MRVTVESTGGEKVYCRNELKNVIVTSYSVGTTSFTFHKALDSFSPRLQDAAIRGTTLPSVITHYRDATTSCRPPLI